MISLEPELQTLRDTLGDRAADHLLARERREVFSLYPEIRLVAWAGAMLLATAAGIVLKDNYQRLGPAAVAAIIGAVAVACYVWVWRHRDDASIADDSILLLGALLVSADAAFLESQYHYFGDHWHRQFLVVAVLHGIAAYLYGSRTVLSLAVVAVAGWLGLERHMLERSFEAAELSARAAGCASVAGIWRILNRRPEFHTTLEHFTANFALLAGFFLIWDEDTRIAACAVTFVVAAAVILWGFRTREEAFALYAVVYAVIAVDANLAYEFHEHTALLSFLILLSIIATIATLVVIHARFRRLRDEG